MLLPLAQFPEFVPLDVEQDEKELLDLFSCYFKGSIDEIKSAVKGARVGGYDYSRRMLFGIRHPEDDTLAAACILVQQRTKKHRVLEIVWFATDPKLKGNGYGSTLFYAVMALAKGSGDSAVLVTSTNRALSFWMSRSKSVLARTVLRGKSRARIENASLSPDEEENRRNHAVLTKLVAEKDVKFEALPKHSLLEDLYKDKVNRNRKGRITAGQTFAGSPYRYNIEGELWCASNK